MIGAYVKIEANNSPQKIKNGAPYKRNFLYIPEKLFNIVRRGNAGD